MADMTHIAQKINEKEEKSLSPDESKLKKLEEILLKLQTAVEHKESNYERSNMHSTERRNQNNKSNISAPTTSRFKEEKNDKEFLSNYMNDEHVNITPKNMHLLTDDDTNQSISLQDKYQNLCKLMMDDKNITEFNFIRNPEERIKLFLYVVFSKKSRDLFMEDDHPKHSRTQILFHKINDMHIPKFGYKPITNNFHKSISNSINESNCISSSNNNDEKDMKNKINDVEDRQSNKGDEENQFTDCYFRQNKKGYFHIPTLVKIEKKKSIKKEYKKQNTFLGDTKIFNPFVKKEEKKKEDIFWDPEIDADTLSYINHNFICIEDIYNGKNMDDEDNENINQNEGNNPSLTPIKAKEVFFNKDENNNDSREFDNLERSNKNLNKFMDYIAINPKVSKFEYVSSSQTQEEFQFNEDLRNHYNQRLNNMLEVDLNYFPNYVNYNPKRIERYLRFEKFKEERREIEITLGPKSTKEESEEDLKEILENDENDKNDKIDKIEIGKIKNEEGLSLKERSFSKIEEKRSFSLEDEEDLDGNKKNDSSINSHNSQILQKSVLNFEDNSKSENQPFSSEKSKSKSEGII